MAFGLKRPPLRRILIVVNLVVLVLPIVGFFSLRLYDTELIRQTESSLIAQSAFVATAFSQEAERQFKSRGRNLLSQTIEAKHPRKWDARLSPIHPTLTLSDDKIFAPAPAPTPPGSVADKDLRDAGKALASWMQESQRTTLAGIRIVDPNGTVVGSTRGELGESLADREEIQAALTGKPTSILRRRVSDSPTPPIESMSRRTGVRAFVAIPIWYEDRILGAVVASRTPLSLQKALYQHRNTYIAFALLILLASLLMSFLTAFTIQRPIRGLLRITREIEAGESPTPLVRPSTREFEELSDAMIRMDETLTTRAKYIEEFAQNVSHEFKTPITSLRGSIELLEDHFETMTTDERAAFLGVLRQDTDRMERLVKGLLELARADVATPTRSQISIESVIDEVANHYHEGFLSTSGEFHSVLLSETAAKALVSNLAKNAKEAGAKSCRFEGTIQGRKIRITVTDDGGGITERDQEKIFTSFFTTRRETGGTGLGLPIVRRLVETAEGSFSLLSSKPGETVFEVWLPLANLPQPA